jgi:septal ring factor EnvC (AmiA/AmiB activator)
VPLGARASVLAVELLPANRADPAPRDGVARSSSGSLSAEESMLDGLSDFYAELRAAEQEQELTKFARKKELYSDTTERLEELQQEFRARNTQIRQLKQQVSELSDELESLKLNYKNQAENFLKAALTFQDSAQRIDQDMQALLQELRRINMEMRDGGIPARLICSFFRHMMQPLNEELREDLLRFINFEFQDLDP